MLVNYVIISLMCAAVNCLISNFSQMCDVWSRDISLSSPQHHPHPPVCCYEVSLPLIFSSILTYYSLLCPCTPGASISGVPYFFFVILHGLSMSAVVYLYCFLPAEPPTLIHGQCHNAVFVLMAQSAGSKASGQTRSGMKAS